MLIFDVSNAKGMTLSFGSKDTERIWDGERIIRIPLLIQKLGRRKLRMLHCSQDINDLRIPPSNKRKK